MYISPFFHHSEGKLCKYSPNEQYICNKMKHRLIIRDSETLQLIQLYNFLEEIHDVIWSNNSELILCILLKKEPTIQIWKIKDNKWHYKIYLPSIIGINKVIWSPDDNSILVVDSLQVIIFLFF